MRGWRPEADVNGLITRTEQMLAEVRAYDGPDVSGALLGEMDALIELHFYLKPEHECAGVDPSHQH